MASFSKADAKVRTIFEPPKLFRSFFSKSFFEAAGSNSCSFVQYFNSSAFLSRKRVQKYCFTAYTPNHPDTFFILFCFYMPKSLILKRCRRACFITSGFSWWSVIPYYLYTRAHTRDLSKQPTFHTPAPQATDLQHIIVYDIRNSACTSYTNELPTEVDTPYRNKTIPLPAELHTSYGINLHQTKRPDVLKKHRGV